MSTLYSGRRGQKHLETEGVAQSETSYFIQARQTDGWKKFVGMDQAIQVRRAKPPVRLTP